MTEWRLVLEQQWHSPLCLPVKWPWRSAELTLTAGVPCTPVCVTAVSHSTVSCPLGPAWFGRHTGERAHTEDCRVIFCMDTHTDVYTTMSRLVRADENWLAGWQESDCLRHKLVSPFRSLFLLLSLSLSPSLSLAFDCFSESVLLSAQLHLTWSVPAFCVLQNYSFECSHAIHSLFTWFSAVFCYASVLPTAVANGIVFYFVVAPCDEVIFQSFVLHRKTSLSKDGRLITKIDLLAVIYSDFWKNITLYRWRENYICGISWIDCKAQVC